MKTLLFILILFQSKASIAQDLNSLHLKINIIDDILFKISAKNSNGKNKNISIISVDTRYRSISYENGFAYQGLLLSEYKKDSVLIDSLNKRYLLKNTVFIESDLNAFRGDIIKSTHLDTKDSCKDCTKLYVEIKEPLEGWQNINVRKFLGKKHVDSADFNKYYGENISFPVFIYSEQNGKHYTLNLIYVYHISENNNSITFFKEMQI